MTHKPNMDRKPTLVVNTDLETATEVIDDLHAQLGEVFRYAYGTRQPDDMYHVKAWAEECDVQFIVILRRLLNIEAVMKAVGDVYGFDRRAIISPARSHSLVKARHHVAWFLRTRGPRVWSLLQIGRVIGNRDHTTIIHAVEAFPKSADEGRIREVDRKVIKSYIDGEFLFKGGVKGQRSEIFPTHSGSKKCEDRAVREIPAA